MNNTWRFSYGRANGSESFDDGVITEMPFGIHFELWGGENCHYFTAVGGQSGDWTAALVTSVVDSVDVPVAKWTAKWTDSESVAKACEDAARSVAAHCDAATDLLVEAVLTLFVNDSGDFSKNMESLMSAHAIHAA